MGVQRTAGRVVISREGFSGWKGIFPPSLGGGARTFRRHDSYNHRVYRWDVYWNRRAGNCSKTNDPCAGAIRNAASSDTSRTTIAHATDREQANKLLQSMLQKAGANDPRVMGFEQRFKLSIVVDKRIMLPQQLTMTRLQSVEFESSHQSFSEDVTKNHELRVGPQAGGQKEFTMTYALVLLFAHRKANGFALLMVCEAVNHVDEFV